MNTRTLLIFIVLLVGCAQINNASDEHKRSESPDSYRILSFDELFAQRQAPESDERPVLDKKALKTIQAFSSLSLPERSELVSAQESLRLSLRIATFQKRFELLAPLMQVEQVAKQFQAKVDTFKDAIDSSSHELKPDLEVIHQQVLSPMPNLMRRFLTGRIVNNTARPTTHLFTLLSSMELTKAVDQDEDDPMARYKQMQHLLKSYKKTLNKTYPKHKKSPMRSIMFKEYNECVVPLVDCMGVLVHAHENKPEAFQHALAIWKK